MCTVKVKSGEPCRDGPGQEVGSLLQQRRDHEPEGVEEREGVPRGVLVLRLVDLGPYRPDRPSGVAAEQRLVDGVWKIVALVGFYFFSFSLLVVKVFAFGPIPDLCKCFTLLR